MITIQYIPETTFVVFKGGTLASRNFDTFRKANEFAAKMAEKEGVRAFIAEIKGSYVPESLQR